MGVQSTKYVSRQFAVDRIKQITELKQTKKYAETCYLCFEPDYDVVTTVNSDTVDNSGISDWTDKMLEKVLDMPFYRESMFDNYIKED